MRQKKILLLSLKRGTAEFICDEPFKKPIDLVGVLEYGALIE